MTQAHALMDGFEALAIVLEKGCNSSTFIVSITSRNAEVVIPSRKTALLGENMIARFVKTAMLLSDFPIVLSGSVDWLSAVKNVRDWCSLISG